MLVYIIYLIYHKIPLEKRKNDAHKHSSIGVGKRQ